MKRLTLLLLMGLGWAGCPEHEPQVLMAQAALVPEEGCVFQSQSGGSILSRSFGRLDLAVNRYGYLAGIQMFNGMASSLEANGLEPENGYLENNIIQLIGGHVSYTTSGLSVDLGSFFQYSPTVVTPEEAAVAVVNLLPADRLALLRTDPVFSGTKGLGPYARLNECLSTIGPNMESIPRQFENAPIGGRRATIIARVTFEGRLQDGTEVFSNEFVYPLEVCMGCYVTDIYDSAEANFPDNVVECPDDEQGFCVTGADGCVSWSHCAALNQTIPDDVLDQIEQCAGNPGFGLTSEFHPYCGQWRSDQPVGFKEFFLRCQYTFAKWNAFCSFGVDEVLWPGN